MFYSLGKKNCSYCKFLHVLHVCVYVNEKRKKSINEYVYVNKKRIRKYKRALKKYKM